MVWVYALIGLVVGLIIGALAMRYGNKTMRQQDAIKAELDTKKEELDTYRNELVSHFARSAELLDNMAKDYRQLYQHMAKSSNELMPDMPVQDNPFNYRHVIIPKGHLDYLDLPIKKMINTQTPQLLWRLFYIIL